MTQTYTWIQSHLVEDSTVSLPKHEVYEEYRRFCQASKFEPLCVADFGKAMKHVFPQVKPRRLGQRGNSKYCYSGLKMKYAMNKPTLPSLDPDEPQYEACDPDEMDHKTSSAEDAHHNVDEASSEVILSWAEKVVNSHFMTMKELSLYLIEEELVDSRSAAAQRVRAVRVGENGASDKNVKVKEEFPKRSAQINFNKTLGKKEQSRKLLEQTKGSKLGAAAPKGKKGRKTSGNGKPAAVLDHFKAADNGLEEDFERICKEEPKEDDEELDFSTHNSQPLSDELAGAGLANKVSLDNLLTVSRLTLDIAFHREGLHFSSRNAIAHRVFCEFVGNSSRAPIDTSGPFSRWAFAAVGFVRRHDFGVSLAYSQVQKDSAKAGNRESQQFRSWGLAFLIEPVRRGGREAKTLCLGAVVAQRPCYCVQK